ncbi:hypothetical protein [Microbacterium sp. T32]|uniref:hypothetical protein n=1 Tax=Microbacterium sp. T32 TaxID=1776083 RepID=UPI0012E7179D|nr:hypothetical protein [Microbacterium sp. T32]
MDAVDELRALAREVQGANAGQVRTHRVGCWKWHAECLAEMILEVTSDEGRAAPTQR